MYTIIEDCSPYYIRFTWDGLSDVIKFCNGYTLPSTSKFGYNYVRTVPNFGQLILDMVPMAQQLELNKNRVAFLASDPGFYYGAHKDGIDHRFSLNIAVKILDDKCVTSWYTDEQLSGLKVTTTSFPSLGAEDSKYPGSSREILEWDKTKHQPVKTMIARPNEAILFNTDIYHSWDNSNSQNNRVLLALRHVRPAEFYFEDVRKIMFGY